MYDKNNIFARILRGEIPCHKVFEDDCVLAFKDITPKAPVHILVIPKGDYVDIMDFSANASANEIECFWRAVTKIAEEQNIAKTGFRSIANTGANGGQEVPHFHLHLLGGTAIGPMVSTK